MILVDTSIWIDHLRTANVELSGLLHKSRVLTHPFVLALVSTKLQLNHPATQ